MVKVYCRTDISDRDIDALANSYGARYVLQAPAPKRGGGYLNFPSIILYRENLNKEEEEKGYSNYICCTIIDNKILVSDGSFVENMTFNGIEYRDGLLYSVYRNNCVWNDKGLYIDGGQDYIHTSSNEVISFKVKDGEIVLKE